MELNVINMKAYIIFIMHQPILSYTYFKSILTNKKLNYSQTLSNTVFYGLIESLPSCKISSKIASLSDMEGVVTLLFGSTIVLSRFRVNCTYPISPPTAYATASDQNIPLIPIK